MPVVRQVTPERAFRPAWSTVATRYAFECPHCGERTVVDGAVRDLLVTEGCVGCGRSVSAEAFARQ